MAVIEIFDTDEEQAAFEAATPDQTAPKTRRTTRKKTGSATGQPPAPLHAAESDTTDGDADAPAAQTGRARSAQRAKSAESPESAAEKPKKRTSRAKADSEPGADGEARSRGSRKKKPDPDAPESPAAPKKPAGRRTSKATPAPAASADAAAPATASASSVSAATPDAPRKSRSSRSASRDSSRKPRAAAHAATSPEGLDSPLDGGALNDAPLQAAQDISAGAAPGVAASVQTPAETGASPESGAPTTVTIADVDDDTADHEAADSGVSATADATGDAAGRDVAPRLSLPMVEFSPTQNALAMSLSILPAVPGLPGQLAVDGPLSLLDSPRDNADGEGAPRTSRSRSRSARRRKAAARRRAEAEAAANGETAVLDDSATPADDVAAAETLVSSGVIAVDPQGNAEMDTDDAYGHAAFAPRPGLDRDAMDDDMPAATQDAGDSGDAEDTENSESSESSEDTSPRKKRSRSRGRGRKKKKSAQTDAAETADAAAQDDLDRDFDDDDDFEPEPRKADPKVDRKMLVSVLPGELVEVVMLEAGRVQEYYVEMEHHAKIRGNIYKGVVSNIDVNLQAAFVNYGNVKNGFLQIDEVHPEYWLTHHDPTKGHKYPPIQKVMKPGQEVLVQVVKEPNGAKGAFLTTWVSLAGRFLVLTPGQEQIGISRKVEDGEERNRLRELIKGLNPGEGLGAIVRTVSAGTSKTTLQKDLSFLKRVWKDIRKRAATEKAPCLIYKEPGLATRSVRDYLSDDVSEVWVDDAETADAIRDMTSLLFPRKGDLLHLHQDATKTLWEQFKVRKYLDQIHAREVTLPSGGRLVFDQTEALMAIDINSGKSGGKTNFESMALRTNVEAAEMIAHQLRLRDVGGQVVIDFIEMRDQNHVREVEKTLRNAMKCDRARYDIGKMSAFGLLQIVRQRIGSSAISISQEPCPHCEGTGLRRNMEWQSLQLLRDLKVQMRTAANAGQPECVLQLESELALYMLNHKRERLGALEKQYGIRLEIRINMI